ncbi:flavodoxin family protein [Brachyspira hampsonii]|uniref:Flavodoxin n=1 Tax=Brachyspira hampsonii 30446 TaxID=1289135 RepID=A0A2U4EU41_9SPIR|nr:flavodoxin family protein [Brachyspira hampsonii]EKV56096.1 flavodoxin [Brachyspira hampsonii 30446]MBW5389086.1 flavodoxin [Brachyspira hampsonii]MBW5394037.1 flavodoxin [Brachyspira hampsonii]OEJ18061.1 flavodoxin [Brachyspira hampsonii]
MKYSIVYTSKSGNTEKLALAIKEAADGECLQCVKPDAADQNKINDSDVVFVGAGSYKGTCDEAAGKFMQTLKNKKVFLFMTVGYGNNQEYYDKMLNPAKTFLDSSNTLVGTYACQGQWIDGQKKNLENMLEKAATDDEKKVVQSKLANYDNAMGHPNADDLNKLKEVVKAVK